MNRILFLGKEKNGTAHSGLGLFLAYLALLDYPVNPAKSRSSCQSIQSILSKHPVHPFKGSMAFLITK